MQEANRVNVILSQDGETVTSSGKKSKDGKEYGFVRVGSSVVEFSTEGFARIANRRAIIKGDVEVLNQIFALGANTVLPGRIAVLESTDINAMGKNAADFEENYRKMAGQTGIACVDSEGQIIYRKQFYTTNQDVQDVFVPHANGEQIRAAQAAINTAALKNAGKNRTAVVK